MLAIEIFTSEELATLFGDLVNLIEIHSNLKDELFKLRDRYGFTKTVGPTLLNWVSYFFHLINIFHCVFSQSTLASQLLYSNI